MQWNIQVLILPFNEFWQIQPKPLSRYQTLLSLLKFPSCALSISPCKRCSDLLSSYHRLIVTILEHHINRIIQHIFLVWLWSCVYQKFSPFFLSSDCIRVCQVVRYLEGFLFGAIMNKVSVNVLIIQGFFFFGRIVFLFLLGKYQEKWLIKCLFSFIRNCQTFSQSVCIFYISTNNSHSSRCSTSLPVLNIISL